MLRKAGSPIVLILLLIAFTAGLAVLVHLRFSRGDIYPPYSSLRSDPLGTKALYETLDSLEHITAERNYKPLERAEPPEKGTLLLAGTKNLFLAESRFKVLEDFVENGGRLALLLHPRDERADAGETEELESPEDEGNMKAPPENDKKRKQEQGEEKEKESKKKLYGLLSVEFKNIGEEWGFSPKYIGKDLDAGMWNYRMDLPEILPWHSRSGFEILDPAWNMLYESDGIPVVMERALGEGTVFLAGESYLLSNEAVRRDRKPLFLAYLIGENGHIVFDESHLGIEQRPNIASLARRHGFMGPLAGIILLALLYVWKQSSPLLPPYSSEETSSRDRTVRGKDSMTGFINLLRRGIPRSRLASVCLEEWRKTISPARKDLMERAEKMEKAAGTDLPPRRRNPVDIYRQMKKILTERKSPQ